MTQKKLFLHIDDEHPQIIITDCQRSTKPAIAIAEHIENSEQLNKPAIVVLGEGESDNYIESCFKAGVADYVEKPFNVIAFNHRITRLSEDLEQVRSLQQKDQMSAMVKDSAMVYSVLLNKAFNLISRLSELSSLEDFGTEIVDSFSQMQFNCAIQLRYQGEHYTFDSDGKNCTENEKRVFRLLSNKGSVYKFGRRTIFNTPQISLLVKNMPLQGTPSYNMATKFFERLLPVLGSQFVAIVNKFALYRSGSKLKESVEAIQHHLHVIENESKQKLREKAKTLNGQFDYLQLTEEQEDFFISFMEENMSESEIKYKLASIVDVLKDCTQNMSNN